MRLSAALIAASNSPINITDSLRNPDSIGEVHDITFSHIRAIGEYPSGVTSSCIGRVTGIHFFDLVIDYPDKAGYGNWDNLSDADKTVFLAKNVQDLLFDNVVIRKSQYWTDAFRSENCDNIRLQNCQFDGKSLIPEIDNWLSSQYGTFVNFYR